MKKIYIINMDDLMYQSINIVILLLPLLIYFMFFFHCIVVAFNYWAVA